MNARAWPNLGDYSDQIESYTPIKETASSQRFYFKANGLATGFISPVVPIFFSWHWSQSKKLQKQEI